MKRASQERELHAAVARYLGLALRPPTLWSTFPAGGGGLERGRMLARLGLKPGWPDLIVLHPAPCGATTVLGIELKAASGRQSVVQSNVAAEFCLVDAHYVICRSLTDVEAALDAAAIPRFSRVLGRAA